MIYLLGVFCVLTLALWLLMRKTAAPFAQDSPRVVTTPGEKAGNIPIPRIIWSYWHSESLPLVVRECVLNWKRHAHGHEIRMLHPAGVTQYLDAAELPAGYAGLPEYRKADWLRLALLQRYGGVWLDASLFLTAPLDWIRQLQQKTGADYVGFHIDKFTTDAERPVVENWFMAACPHHPFMVDLLAEFTTNIIGQGDPAIYLDSLRSSGEYAAAVQNINQPDYLAMHVAAGRLLARTDYRLCLVRAEDLAFYYQDRFRWSKTALYLNLAVYRANVRLPGIIKFRSGDRHYFQRRLKMGLYSRQSVVGRYLLALRQAERESLPDTIRRA